LGDLEDPAVLGDVLSHEDEVGMGFHALAQALGEGIDEANRPGSRAGGEGTTGAGA
jgi:hypothetical protein